VTEFVLSMRWSVAAPAAAIECGGYDRDMEWHAGWYAAGALSSGCPRIGYGRQDSDRTASPIHCSSTRPDDHFRTNFALIIAPYSALHPSS
jgi:hypothetical protein